MHTRRLSGHSAQIIFCSRTHSQLAQVVGELLRTPFAEAVRTVVLAGRAQLCVNDVVRALAAAPRMNERCAELRRAGRAKGAAAPKAPKAPGGASASKAAKASASSAGCPFLRKRHEAVAQLRELVLAEPLEVEELAREGRAQSACPYYAARAAVPAAHLILLPYASLLQPDMRCGATHARGATLRAL
jgi:chromosome transmission fidelity protein 1